MKFGPLRRAHRTGNVITNPVTYLVLSCSRCLCYHACGSPRPRNVAVRMPVMLWRRRPLTNHPPLSVSPSPSLSQHRTAPNSAEQHRTALNSTGQHRTAPNSTELHRTASLSLFSSLSLLLSLSLSPEQHRAAPNSTERPRTAPTSTEQPRLAPHRTEQYRTASNSAKRPLSSLFSLSVSPSCRVCTCLPRLVGWTGALSASRRPFGV